ncbi:unnamed protein product [Sphagnum balticum]
MILVGGKQIAEGQDILHELLEHPVLVSSAAAFVALPGQHIQPPPDENGVSTDGHGREHRKFVYVGQRECATVDPDVVEFIGTDDATTCIGVVIRNPQSGLTCVGHLDFVNGVKLGINQMIGSVSPTSSCLLEAHLVGGFDDLVDRKKKFSIKDPKKPEGYSRPLARRILEELQSSSCNFNLQTLCILQHNTAVGSNGFAHPIAWGFVVESKIGHLAPATFHIDARCPDGVVRSLCLFTISSNPNYGAELMTPYKTSEDSFAIGPTRWCVRGLQPCPIYEDEDSWFLEKTSTSPYAEGPDFLTSSRRMYAYLLEHPNWEQTFPGDSPRVFRRSNLGGWDHQLIQTQLEQCMPQQK